LWKTEKLLLGKVSESKIRQIFLSNIIKDAFEICPEDMKERVANKLKASPMLSIQMDETTDIT